MLYSAYICHANSVRPFVRLSVIRVYCTKTTERIIEILSPSDRPIIQVYGHQGPRVNLTASPQRGRQIQGG